jgi:flagellar protein FlaG
MINSVVNTGFQPAVVTRDNAGGSAHASNAAAVPPTSPQPRNAPDTKQLTEAVSKLNDYVQNIHRDLSFSVDKDSGQTVVKVYDSETKEVIRQIPAEETLKLAASLKEHLASLLVQEQA